MTSGEFIAQLPQAELTYFKNLPKYMRDKYYSYLFSCLKKKYTRILPPTDWHFFRVNKLTPYEEIAKKLHISKREAQYICEHALSKIKQIIKENPQKYDF